MIEVIGGIANAARGGQWREWFGVKPDELKWLSSDGINAVIFFLTVLYLTHAPVMSLAAGVAMWLGAAMGWGDYIGASFGARWDNLKENKYIDKVIRWAMRWPRVWGRVGLLVRGLVWGAIVGAVFWYYGREDVAIEFLWRGALMPLAYWFGDGFAKHRARHDDGAAWALGEIFFGIIFWSALYRL